MTAAHRLFSPAPSWSYTVLIDGIAHAKRAKLAPNDFLVICDGRIETVANETIQGLVELILRFDYLESLVVDGGCVRMSGRHVF